MKTDYDKPPADSNAQEAHQKLARAKDFHHGYRAVLLREDIKVRLRKFRGQQSVSNDSHIERCMVTAGIELLLNRPELHQAWIEQLIQATTEDTKLAFSK